jgi:hypothetical protein
MAESMQASWLLLQRNMSNNVYTLFPSEGKLNVLKKKKKKKQRRKTTMLKIEYFMIIGESCICGGIEKYFTGDVNGIKVGPAKNA